MPFQQQQQQERNNNNNNHHHQYQKQQQLVPPEKTIQHGRVVRIEPYGAFIKLDDYRLQGLVHISQISSRKVENINDILSLQDEVYVKVLSIDVTTSDETNKTLHKISLSMKYANQHTGQDLDPHDTNALLESNNTHSSTHKRQRMNGGGDAASDALEREMTARIGMGVARDPAAAMMKLRRAAAAVGKKMTLGDNNQQQEDEDVTDDGRILFNGYALVDDDEGEPQQQQQPLSVTTNVATTLGVTTSAIKSVNDETTKRPPVGRGRGTTLPAWMTRGVATTSSSNGPIKCHTTNNDADSRRRRRRRDRSLSSSSSSSSSHQRKRRKKKNRDEGEVTEERRRRRRRRRSRSSERKRRYDEDDDNDDTSHHSDEKGRSKRRRRRHGGRDDDRRRRRRRRHRSSRTSERRRERDDRFSDSDGSGEGSSGGEGYFKSLDEAKALISKLEKR